MKLRRSTRILVVVSLLAAFGLAFVLTPPRGPCAIRQFDAERGPSRSPDSCSSRIAS
jgi:hypothetical protein